MCVEEVADGLRVPRSHGNDGWTGAGGEDV